MKTFFKIGLAIFIVWECFGNCGAQEESLSTRYAVLESKFLLLIETASARNLQESIVARQVLTESRQREIVAHLKLLAAALSENRLADATALFKTVEDDLDAVEQLLGGSMNKTEAKSPEPKMDSMPDASNSPRSKQNAKKERENTAKANHNRFEIQLMFRLKELRRMQSEIDEWLDAKNVQIIAGATTDQADAKSLALANEIKRVSEIETTVATEAAQLASIAVRDKFDSFVTALVKGAGEDASELATLLVSGERRRDWSMLSDLILSSIKTAIDKLEKSLESNSKSDKSNDPAPTPLPDTAPQSGSPEGYIPSLDELIMIRQIQERIARRIIMCEEWGKAHPERSRELDRALHGLAQEQQNLVDILHGK